MKNGHQTARFSRQELAFGVMLGPWVPVLPGNPLSRLLADLFALGEWARGSNKIIVIIWTPQSPWWSEFKRKQTVSQS